MKSVEDVIRDLETLAEIIEDKFGDSRIELVQNALEYVRAQRPRVMTLEEVKEYANLDKIDPDQRNTRPVWIEWVVPPHKNLKHWAVPGHIVQCLEWDFSLPLTGTLGAYNYNKKWRCWFDMPSDDERKNTPWDNMAAKELAAMLDGIDYCECIPADVIRKAEDSGFVIVYGHSDDCLEFEGAITDEIGAYNGRAIQLVADKISAYNRQMRWVVADKRTLSGKLGPNEIRAKWCPDGSTPWTIETDIPHATFDICDGDEVFCKGVVFSIYDLRQGGV